MSLGREDVSATQNAWAVPMKSDGEMLHGLMGAEVDRQIRFPGSILRRTCLTCFLRANELHKIRGAGVNPILKRRLASLKYQDPEEILRRLMPTIVGILQKSESVAHLSAKQKKDFLEEHQAAFLAFMMKHVAGRQAKVTVCVEELDDFDCVIKGEVGNDTVYKPVQLKQLPSHEVNSAIDLQTLIEGLKSKYPTSSELVVAIWINRDIKLDFRLLRFDGLKVEQLWFFGDAVTGECTLDGGVIADLVCGVRWSGVMKGGIPTVRPIRFKPKST